MAQQAPAKIVFSYSHFVQSLYVKLILVVEDLLMLISHERALSSTYRVFAIRSMTCCGHRRFWMPRQISRNHALKREIAMVIKQHGGEWGECCDIRNWKWNASFMWNFTWAVCFNGAIEVSIKKRTSITALNGIKHNIKPLISLENIVSFSTFEVFKFILCTSEWGGNACQFDCQLAPLKKSFSLKTKS